MSDLNVIKERYRAMTDGELVNFAQEDGAGLTKEAFQLLRDEFNSRNLDTDILEQIEDGTFSEHQEAINRIEKTIVKEFSKTVLIYALNEKGDGKTDQEIIAGLLDNGMDEHDAMVLVWQLEKNAHQLLARAKTTMLSAAFICIAGVAFYMISPKTQDATLTDILSICAIVFGIIRFLKGWFDRNKYGEVIKNIQRDTEIR